MSNKLRICDLHKTYANGVKALKGINLEVQNGMFGLLGPNGAGKSSLMRIISTLQEPSSGQVFFNDVDIADDPLAIRKNLGYLPQEFGVYPRISALDLLDHIATLKGILNKSDRKFQVEALLQQTNLYQHRKQSVHTFSGGMRQRFGIAQALLGAPQLIIVDEPTAGLDPEERYRFLNLLSEIGEQVIVILSTHIVEDVRNLCTRMAIMNQGEIITEGQPNKMIDDLHGRIWKKTISKSHLTNYQQRYQVISTRLVAGETQIHVLADDRPEQNFAAFSPNLEDVYFSSLLQK